VRHSGRPNTPNMEQPRSLDSPCHVRGVAAVARRELAFGRPGRHRPGIPAR
jgi:hypothetical protein